MTRRLATTESTTPRHLGNRAPSTFTLLVRSLRLPPIYPSTALSFYAVVLFGLPDRLVIKNLGAIGTPATIISLGLGVAWVIGRLSSVQKRTTSTVSRAMVAWALVTLLAYGSGMTRALTSAEVRSADRQLIAVLAATGLVLYAVDELRSVERITTVMRWVTCGAAFSSSIAILQFTVGIDLTEYIRLPGFELNTDLIGITERGFDQSFRRVAGTAGHPIEFGVMIAMVLPIAIHLALFARTRKERQLRWVILVILIAGIPMTISRSTVIGVTVALVVLLIAWHWQLRIRAMFVAMVFIVLTRALVPGLVGTILGLFTYADQDSSVQSAHRRLRPRAGPGRRSPGARARPRHVPSRAVLHPRQRVPRHRGLVGHHRLGHVDRRVLRRVPRSTTCVPPGGPPREDCASRQQSCCVDAGRHHQCRDLRCTRLRRVRRTVLAPVRVHRSARSNHRRRPTIEAGHRSRPHRAQSKPSEQRQFASRALRTRSTEPPESNTFWSHASIVIACSTDIGPTLHEPLTHVLPVTRTLEAALASGSPPAPR